MAMQPGKPIIGTDAAIFIDRDNLFTSIQFRWINHDIFTEIDVYLVRNDKSKKLVDNLKTDGTIYLDKTTSTFKPIDDNTILDDGKPISGFTGRFVAIPGHTYNVKYTFTKKTHWDDFVKKYPVFKFRIEMVGNPSVFAETNEFKVVY